MTMGVGWEDYSEIERLVFYEGLGSWFDEVLWYACDFRD